MIKLLIVLILLDILFAAANIPILSAVCSLLFVIVLVRWLTKTVIH